MICEICGKPICNEEIGLCEVCAPLGEETPSSHGWLTPFSDQSRFGLKSKKTEAVIINPIFSFLEYAPDSDTIFRVELMGQHYLIPSYYYGYMPQIYTSYSDHNPKYLSKTGYMFDSRIWASFGFGVYTKSSHSGVIDKHYNYIISPVFDFAMNYSGEDGFGKYMIDLWYYSDNKYNKRKYIHFIKSRDYFTKEILIDYLDLSLYDGTDEFWYYDEKLKTVFCPFLNGRSKIPDGPCGYFQNEKYGLADSSGRLLTGPLYDELESSIQPGIYKYRINERYGYMDSHGNDVRVTPEEINDYSKIQRVCRHCGKVWFSYVGDESVLEPSFRRTFALGMVRSFMSEQGRIENIVDERLKRDAAQKLRQCPNCGKKDYDELILL